MKSYPSPIRVETQYGPLFVSFIANGWCLVATSSDNSFTVNRVECYGSMRVEPQHGGWVPNVSPFAYPPRFRRVRDFELVSDSADKKIQAAVVAAVEQAITANPMSYAEAYVTSCSNEYERQCDNVDDAKAALAEAQKMKSEAFKSLCKAEAAALLPRRLCSHLMEDEHIAVADPINGEVKGRLCLACGTDADTYNEALKKVC